MAKAPSTTDRAALLQKLSARFERNMHRHEGISWADVQARIEAHPGAWKALHDMERTGGEPDVIGRDTLTGQVTFCDCSAESPDGRRSACARVPACRTGGR